MSSRDYRLTIQLEIDRQSLAKMAEKISEVLNKTIGKTFKDIHVTGVGARRDVGDARIVNLLTKIHTELSAMSGNMSRVLRTAGRRTVQRREGREEGEGGFLGGVSRSLDVLTRGGVVKGGFQLLKNIPAFAAVATLAGVFIEIGEKIIDLLTQLLQKAFEFSGIGKSTMKMLDVAISLLLKPIADVVGLLLRPLARLLLPVAIALNKLLEPFITQALKAIDRLFGPTGEGPGAEFYTPKGERIDWDAAISKATDKMKDLWSEFITTLKALIPPTTGFGIPHVVFSIIELLQPHFENMGKSLSDAWNNFVNFISGLFAGVGKALGDAWDNVVKFFGWLGSTIGENLQNAWNTLVEFFKDVGDKLGKIISDAWKSLVSFFSDVGDKLGKVLVDVWNGLVGFFNNVGDTLGKIFRPVWDTLSSAFETVKNVLVNTFSPVWEKIKEIFTTVRDVLVGTFSSAWDKIREVFSGVLNTIRTILEPAWNALTGFFEWLKNTLSPIAGFFGFGARQQFGGDIRHAGMYYLEAGEMVLNRSDVMRMLSTFSQGGNVSITVPVTINGTIYGVSDLEEIIRNTISREVGNVIYDTLRRGVRV